jgi:hypothetical protein
MCHLKILNKEVPRGGGGGGEGRGGELWTHNEED